MNTEIRTVVRLVSANKAKLAFLAPLITAVGAAVASWVVSGEFNANEIRAAAGGAVLAAVAGVGAWLAEPGEAEVRVRDEAGVSDVGVLLLCVGVLIGIVLAVFVF